MAFERLRRRIADWISPPCQIVMPPRRNQAPPRQPKALWTGIGSGTEREILALFTDPSIRLTRREISARINQTTASIILPRMVERGQLWIEPKSLPYVYRLRSPGEFRSITASSETSPWSGIAGDMGVTSGEQEIP